MSTRPAEDTTPPAAPPFARADLERLGPLRRLPGRNSTKADILVYRLPCGDVALKDYAARPWWLRGTLGRWLVAREATAFAAARGLAGLPLCYGRIGRHALATAWVAGEPLATRRPGEVGARTFEDLSRVLDRLHDRGIALGDLHHRDVLVCPDGSVRIVDLATAIVLGPRPGWLRRRLFERWRESDLVARERMKARFAGEDPALGAARVSPAAAARHRRARRLKALWNRLR